jgi:hypothetical protein
MVCRLHLLRCKKKIMIEKCFRVLNTILNIFQVHEVTCTTQVAYIYTIKHLFKWAASGQNQQSAFATSMDPDQPAHPCTLIRIHAVRLQTLLQVKILIANSKDPDQTAWTRRLVWIYAGRKHTRLVCLDAAQIHFQSFHRN